MYTLGEGRGGSQMCAMEREPLVPERLQTTTKSVVEWTAGLEELASGGVRWRLGQQPEEAT